MYIGYGIVISVASIILERYSFKNTLNFKSIFVYTIFSVFEGFGYRQLCGLFRLSGFFGYKKRKHQWSKISRKSQNKMAESENL